MFGEVGHQHDTGVGAARVPRVSYGVVSFVVDPAEPFSETMFDNLASEQPEVVERLRGMLP